MVNKPHLKENALFTFLYHQNVRQFGPILQRTQRYHGILLCRRYLMEFCRECKNVQLNLFVQDTWISLVRMVKNCIIEFSFTDGRSVAILIRVADVHSVHINLWSSSLTKKFTREWIQICRALGENTTLQRIEVAAQMPRESCNRFLLDCVPDKITRLYTDPEICTTLGKRRTLDVLNCFVQQMNLYYYQLLQIQTRYIEFFYDYDGGLWELGNCGPLLPNPTIQKFKIHFRIGNFIDEYNEHEPMKSKFNSDFMPAYQNALNCLCEVNPTMHLKLYDWNHYGFSKTIDDVVQKMHDMVRNAKLFVQIANETGIQRLSIRIQQQLALESQKESTWNLLNARLADEFHMKTKAHHQLVGYIQYRGSKIKLIQDTKMLFKEDGEGSMLDLINFAIE